MPSHEDLLADIREDEAAARELIEYKELCEAGFQGTLEDYRTYMASRKPLPAKATKPGAEILGDDDLDDIPF